MPGSSLRILRRSMRPPVPSKCTDSGIAFDRPPAPTSWISRIGLSSPIAQHASMTSCARRCISGLPRCTEAKSRSAELMPAPIDDAAPPPEPDQHRRAAEHDDLRARHDRRLFDVLAAHVAEAARDHDRLVIAAQRRASRRLDPLLERAEVAVDVRPAEFVVERGRADRPVEHDLQRDDDALGLAEILLPGLHEPGNAQVRDREADQAGLGLGAATRRALVADLAARARRGARKRRDRGRVIVRLDLHQDVDRLVGRLVVAAARLREPAPARRAFDDGRVVAVRREHALRVERVRVADHAEQRLVAALAVDDPVGVEDLVAAMLGVRLREHHQLDVGRVAPQLPLEARRPGSRSRRPTARGRARRSRCSSAARPCARTGTVGSGCGGCVLRTARPRRRACRARSRSCGRGSAPRRAARSCRGERLRPTHDNTRCRARCAARRASRRHARCRSPWSTTARPCRNAARRAAVRPRGSRACVAGP